MAISVGQTATEELQDIVQRGWNRLKQNRTLDTLIVVQLQVTEAQLESLRELVSTPSKFDLKETQAILKAAIRNDQDGTPLALPVTVQEKRRFLQLLWA